MNAETAALDGKTVLVRIDPETGINGATGQQLVSLARQGARVAVVGGYGNPQGEVNPALSLRRFLDALEQATGMPVLFVPECVGAGAEAGLARAPFGAIVLMENLRFHPDQHRQSRAFAMRLSALGDYFTVPGGIPATDPGWIRALTELLPSPETEFRQSA